MYIIFSFIVGLLEQASLVSPVSSVERGAGNLLALIREGSEFHDEYQSEGGIPKSTYDILPCVYTNSSTQTLQATPVENISVPQSSSVLNIVNSSNTQNLPSRSNITSNLYSVMYPGAMNKITIKRKPNELGEPKQQMIPIIKNDAAVDKVTSCRHLEYFILRIFQLSVFKKPINKCIVQSKKGCRCGNATATPGKLTCCGQRCPCYVEGKACIECRCRGCRNPHRPDGLKVLFFYLENQVFQNVSQIFTNFYRLNLISHVCEVLSSEY